MSQLLHIGGWAHRHAAFPDAQAWRDRIRALQMGQALPPLSGSRRLSPPQGSLSRFGIPPIYRPAIHGVQWQLLDLAETALTPALNAQPRFDPRLCDVIFVSHMGLNRSFENEARIRATCWAHSAWRQEAAAQQLHLEWCRRLEHRFQASSHDKVGEMASALAARVASHFKLQGRILALEAGTHGGLEALRVAAAGQAALRGRAVLILAAQTLDSPCWHAPDLREAAALPEGLCESACALLLLPQAQEALASFELTLNPPSQHSPGLPPCLDLHGPSAELLCGPLHAMSLFHGLAACLPEAPFVPAPWAGVQGLDALGNPWQLCRQEAASAGQETALERPAPIAVVGAGACFGGHQGMAAYWQALNQATNCFKPLTAHRHQRDALMSAGRDSASSYYIHAASHAELDLPSDELLRTLASQALGEACQPLKLAPPGELLLVSAIPLSTTAERLLGARSHLPALLELLDGWAQDEGWPAAQRQRLWRALVDQALQEALPQPGAFSASVWLSQMVRQLGLTPRVVALEAACAGSMAALDLALNELRHGHAQAALVLGVEAPVNASDLVLCSAQRMLAPQGMASFAEDAQGFTPGDGAGAVLLMRTERAQGLGLPIQAELLSMGSCTDSKSMIAPNVYGQSQAMQRAFAALDFSPRSVQFLETHGTGTLIGDEVETQSLALHYGHGETALPLGALKARFGHCFSAAGMASLLKTLLALQHECMPANLFERPHKRSLNWQTLGFDPLLQPKPWPRGPDRRRAAINAFGTGGINYHLVLQEA